jgi:hypothetical protein
MKQHMTNEADARLAFYIPPPADQLPQPAADIPPRPHLPPNVADTPLVRLYNFLRTFDACLLVHVTHSRRNDVPLIPTGDTVVSGKSSFSMRQTLSQSFKASRMRSLGWADYLKVEMTNNRKTLVVSYWMSVPVRDYLLLLKYFPKSSTTPDNSWSSATSFPDTSSTSWGHFDCVHHQRACTMARVCTITKN